MSRFIDSSIDGVNGCKLSLTMRGQLKIELPFGWKSHVYTQKQIINVTPIDEDKYRSAGGAAAGAIIGGVLTGGIGLLAGAALGGRRRQTNSYLVTFDDGHYIAFEESKKANLKPLIKLIQSEKLESLILERDVLTKSEGKNVTEIPPSVKVTTNEQVVIEQDDNKQPNQPEKINKSKGWLIFWGLIVLVLGLTLFSPLGGLLVFVSFYLYRSAYRFFFKNKPKLGLPTSFYFKLKRKLKGAFFITSTASITFVNLFGIFFLIEAIGNQNSGANSVKLLTKNVIENRPVIKSVARTKRDADYEDWKKDYEKRVSKKDNTKEIKKNLTSENSIIFEDIIYPKKMKKLIASGSINDFDYSFYDHLIAVSENSQVSGIAYKRKKREVWIALQKKHCSWDDKKAYHKVAQAIQSVHGKKYVNNYVVYCSD